MLLFIKDYQLTILKKKYIMLYVLNLIDIVFTILLLRTGYFKEVNLFMIKAVDRPMICVFLKVVLPAVLLGYVYQLSKSGEEDERKVSNIAVNISLTIYILVNMSHLVWTAMLPFLMLGNV
ncbi:MAG: hypothetical protein K0R34_607 [Herbinix sp.]|jgi:hypothetical protein|nr:hypothetical protein [Herbinix sp.]